MLTITEHEELKIKKLMTAINVDYSSIELISKDNKLYTTKNNMEIKELLYYLILFFPDAHSFTLIKKGSLLNVFVNTFNKRTLINLEIKKDNHYETAQIGNYVFSNVLLKKFIDFLEDKNDLYECKENLTFPFIGNVQINAMVFDKSITIKLNKESIKKSYILNRNVLYVGDNVFYKARCNIKGFEIDVTENFKLPVYTQNIVDEYNETISKMFSELSQITYSGYKNTLVELRFISDGMVDIHIPVYFSFLRQYLDKPILNYIVDNYTLFYKPVFNNLIKLIANTTDIDNNYETAEQFKDYMTMLKMFKI